MLSIFKRKRKESEADELMWNEKKVKPTPLVANPQTGDFRQRIDAMANSGQETPIRETPARQTYVDRRIAEAMAELNEKKDEMNSLEQEIQACMNDANVLQEIRDGKALMYITDVLEMIDEFRAKEFDAQGELLDALEQDVIQSMLQKMMTQKRKR